MDGGRPDEQIGAHIELISSRPAPEAERLVASMIGRCWPGGPSDRSQPAALDWVRRWGPRGQVPLPPVCSCARGRCSLCN